MELVSHIIAIHGANITGVNHNRTADNKNITDCFLDLDIETRNLEHLMEIKTALREAGFQVSRR